MLDMVILKTTATGLFVPSLLLTELGYVDNVITLDFRMPRQIVSAINKRIGKKLKFKVQLSNPELANIRREIKAANPDISNEDLNVVSMNVLKNRLSEPGTVVLYWGNSSNELDDHHNLNAWLYWGSVAFNKLLEEDSKSIRKLFPGITCSFKEKQCKSLRLFGVPIITDEVNYLDRLVYACYVNRIKYTKQQLVYLVLLTILWNATTSATGRSVNPAGQVRKLLQGAVDRPLQEDIETGKVLELDTESSVEWWIPTDYYQRSPIAMYGQQYRVTHCNVKFNNNRIIWNKDRSGYVANNSEFPNHWTVRSLPGAQSKIEKISNRSTLFYANRVEVCEISKKHGVVVREVESPLKFAIQEDGLIFTHYQGKYHLANSCMGTYIDKSTPLSRLNYNTDVECEEGTNIPTQESLVRELANELGINLDEAVTPEFVDVEELFV